ncbi:MAG: DUF2062 domain-containing protein, partial [Planctomycetota bacterium]
MFRYFKEKLQKYILLILQLKDSPESIARGVAIGMVVAMTPTVGIQMMIVLFISLFIRLNRIAGCIVVYISNPFTMIPIYWLDYWIGAKVMGYEMITRQEFSKLFEFQTSTFYEQFLEFSRNCLALGMEVVIPMFVGGLILGLILGIPLYPITLKAVRNYQEKAKKEQKQEE